MGGLVGSSWSAQIIGGNGIESTRGLICNHLRCQASAVDESLAIHRRTNRFWQAMHFGPLLGPDPYPPSIQAGSRTMSIEAIQATIFLLFLGVCFLAGSIAVRQND